MPELRPVRRVELLDRLIELIAPERAERPIRVAIDGPDAAGKTTLADELASVLRADGREVIRASADDFLRPKEQRHARGADSPLGYYLDAVDYDALAQSLLEPLGAGGSRTYRPAVFDVFEDAPLEGRPATAPDTAVLIMDGVFLQRPEINDLWDVRVYVTAEAEVRLKRALSRDTARFGSADEVKRRYRMRYLPGQQMYVAELRPDNTADALVINDDPTAPLLRIG
jgi:uridine kinase